LHLLLSIGHLKRLLGVSSTQPWMTALQLCDGSLLLRVGRLLLHDWCAGPKGSAGRRGSDWRRRRIGELLLLIDLLLLLILLLIRIWRPISLVIIRHNLLPALVMIITIAC
jgi:hypothetical protein